MPTVKETKPKTKPKLRSKTTILGIRHHGPGSARSLVNALAKLKLDIILIEGPSDLNHMLPYLAHEELEPPVALVSYQPTEPAKASYFPFTVFSPEFQAIKFGLAHQLMVRFCDLPQANMLAAGVAPAMPSTDPMMLIAQASGHKHYERWWNELVEERRNATDMFEAVLELMQALRETDVPLKTSEDPEAFETNLEKLKAANPKAASEELERSLAEHLEKRQRSLVLAEQREACMRNSIRQAKAEGFRRIVVVCGAFHGPALTLKGQSAKKDNAILADMPRVDVEAAWIPWTYGRLAVRGGYGAGVASPGWYHHLWMQGSETVTATEFSSEWLTKIAGFLRTEGFTVSSAHIIETVRLAEALAALREQSYPSLSDLLEATQTVMCAGNPNPIRLIQEKLIVSERMGFVPADFPMVPLQKDLYRLQQELSLSPSLEATSLKLDLRETLDLKRSQVLYRLQLLGVSWGEKLSVRGKQGSYHESWVLTWKPELALKVIEANRWGLSVESAALACTKEAIAKAQTLDALSQLLDMAMFAALPDLMADLITRLSDLSASSSDLNQLMKALPPLISVRRYGSVRQIANEAIDPIIKTLVSRIKVHLFEGCKNLKDELAKERSELIVQSHALILSLNDADLKENFQAELKRIAQNDESHGLIAGKLCRLLSNTRVFSKQELFEQLDATLLFNRSQTYELETMLRTAFWIEGFFKGSAQSLVHDDDLWRRLDAWLVQLAEENFLDLLPLLRRTFSSYSQSSKEQLRLKAKQDFSSKALSKEGFSHEQAAQVIPYLAQLTGLNQSELRSNLERGQA